MRYPLRRFKSADRRLWGVYCRLSRIVVPRRIRHIFCIGQMFIVRRRSRGLVDIGRSARVSLVIVTIKKTYGLGYVVAIIAYGKMWCVSLRLCASSEARPSVTIPRGGLSQRRTVSNRIRPWHVPSSRGFQGFFYIGVSWLCDRRKGGDILHTCIGQPQAVRSKQTPVSQLQ